MKELGEVTPLMGRFLIHFLNGEEVREVGKAVRAIRSLVTRNLLYYDVAGKLQLTDTGRLCALALRAGIDGGEIFARKDGKADK